MKKALVTGAGSRLGPPLAKFLAARGFHLILHGYRSAEKVLALAAELRGDGAEVDCLFADFSDRAATADFCGRLTEKFGAPKLIINNASLFTHDFPGRGDPGLLAQSLAVHVEAPFQLIETALRAKPATVRLDVVNILDQKLINPNPDYYSYTLGKAGLMAMTELLARSGRTDLRCVGLLPGLMFPSGPQSESRFIEDQQKIPTGRATPAAAICAAIGFFLDHPDWRSDLLPIDGGEHLIPRARDIAFE